MKSLKSKNSIKHKSKKQVKDLINKNMEINNFEKKVIMILIMIKI